MRNKCLRQFILILFLISCFRIGSAQKAPIKFGKIDIEDLKMSHYEHDTSAIAVVLCDYGVFNPNEFEFTRTCRIKILKKNGVNAANVYVRSRGNIYVKGRTYNLVNGEIEVTKMKNESIFDERVENLKVATRFSLPNVQEGSIIEYSYRLQGVPYEWKFQREIPVKWSELRMPQSPYVTVQKNFFGFELLSIIEDSRWVAKNMPAFRKEPYMNSITNYLSKFEFDIEQVNIPGRLYEEFTTSWEEVSETLLDDDNFGVKLRGDLFLNNEAKMIKSMNLSDLEKAKFVYELVKKEITWNEIKQLYAYSQLNFVYNNKKVGGCAEINLILVALLNKIGLKAYPVVLSTRGNGMLSPITPSLNKLNYVIALLEIEKDRETYLLDATDRLAPFGILPKRCINGEGRLVNKNISKFVNLESKVKSKEVVFSNLILSSLGELNGSIAYKYIDYAAYDMRKEMEKYTSEDDYIKNIESNHVGMNIEEYEFKNMDSIYKPISVKYIVNFHSDVDVISNNIYVNPLLTEKIDNNPFKINEREYPVDFIHPIEKTYILNLTIPQDYSVSYLPKPVKIALPNKKGSFSCSITSAGKKIQYIYNFAINEPIILPTEYKFIKEFFELIVTKNAETIILKRNEI
ncbi:MAG: hypothetical protein KAQ75_15630 [Bacteroidales bacterium]|nr:hypothetical protein [Bacteroidales bacterium]